jgi:3-methyladenine DNA glycosylase AlkD
MPSAPDLARAIRGELGQLRVANAPALRGLRRKYSRLLAKEPAELVLRVAQALHEAGDFAGRMLGCELIAAHRGGLHLIDGELIERLSRGLADWGSVDMFGVTLAGPAWRDGKISDRQILSWAKSEDRWRRRLSLVATVRLNTRTGGGKGDAPRTLRIARLHVADRDDMVVKAMSWALRELGQREPAEVRAFLREQGDRLAPRVRREVGNKLKTGLKNPRR